MIATKGIYQKGSVKLLAAVSWLDGTEVEVVAQADDEVCADGTPWPRTAEERNAWVRQMEQAPPVFDSEEGEAQFKRALDSSRAGELRDRSQLDARLEKIARSFD